MRFASALALAGALGLTLVPRPALAHCDTLDGPVVKDARVALDAQDVTPVLKWVSRDKEGEGEPYTGLKPAGTAVDPGIAASDTALETGSVEALAKLVTAEVERGVRQRYAEAAEARRHATASVEQGRQYVAAYVEFMHYAERLLLDATGSASHTEPAAQHSH